MSTMREHPREGCLFGIMCSPEEMAMNFFYLLCAFLLLLSYHRRLRMILRSARAARVRRSGYSQLVYVCGSHGYGGLDGGRDGVGAW